MSLLAALLWFDSALTFPSEVQRIWRRKFSGAKLIYIITRYTSIIDRVLLVREESLWNTSYSVSTHSGDSGCRMHMGLIPRLCLVSVRLAKQSRMWTAW